MKSYFFFVLFGCLTAEVFSQKTGLTILEGRAYGSMITSDLQIIEAIDLDEPNH